MGDEALISPVGDKVPFFWIFQFIGDDTRAKLVAQTADNNQVQVIITM